MNETMSKIYASVKNIISEQIISKLFQILKQKYGLKVMENYLQR